MALFAGKTFAAYGPVAHAASSPWSHSVPPVLLAASVIGYISIAESGLCAAIKIADAKVDQQFECIVEPELEKLEETMLSVAFQLVGCTSGRTWEMNTRHL